MKFINQSINSANANKVLNASQVAIYLDMSEKDVQAIMRVEKNNLQKTGSFSGKMLPYFTINNKPYFYKDQITEWLKDISSNHRQYNTVEGWVSQ